MTALDSQAGALAGFRTPEVCRLARCSFRQADYWARTGLLRPSVMDANGSGTWRLYSHSDVLVAAAFAAVSGAGLGRNDPRQGMAPAFEQIASHVRAHGLSGVLAISGGLLWVNLDAIADPFVDADAIAL